MLNTKKLIAVRKWLWFSQTELAKLIWVRTETIWRYEHNTGINIHNVKRIVNAFNEWRIDWEFICKSTVQYELKDFLT